MSVARIGFSELHGGGPDPLADIVFVHGLGGHPENTWTYTPAKDSRFRHRFFHFRSDRKRLIQAVPSVFWPRELLRQDLSNCRIMTYGYDSDIVSFLAPVDRSSLYQHSNSFLVDLSHRRQKWPARPIIFVAHSLGGILVKDALKQSQDAQYKPKLQNIYENVHSVIFLGTPHRGSDWAALGKSLSIFALGKANDGLLRSLQVGSADLERLTDAFAVMLKANKVKVCSFVESQAITDIPGFANKIVDDFSSRIGDAAEISQVLHANHRTMCKFTGADDSNYQKVLAALKDFVSDIQDHLTVDNGVSRSPEAFFKMLRLMPGTPSPQRLVKMLSVVEQDSHLGHTPQLDDGHFAWVFANLDYQKWLSSRSIQVLWLSGPSQCRLWEVSSYLIQSRRKAALTTIGNEMVLYFFCTPTRLERHMSMTFIHTILYQILQSSSELVRSEISRTFIQALRSNYPDEREKREERQRSWGPLDTDANNAILNGILWAAIEKVLITQGRRQVILAVDGLDGTTEATFLFALRRFIEHITGRIGVKVLVTSRPLPSIKEFFDGFPSIEYNKEREECLARLQIDDARYRKISQGHRGSFQWLWKHEQYVSWSQHKGSRLLHVVGKPGSGKSTLTKFFTQHVRETQTSMDIPEPAPVIAKFFYSYRDGERQRSHHNMFRSILAEIIAQEEPFFYHHIQSIYRAQDCCEGRLEWNYDSLVQALKGLCDYSTNRRFFLILDAIDESDDQDRYMVVNLLHEICSQATSCTVKVFVASRPVDHLGSKWYHNTIRLQDETSADIRQYLLSFLSGFDMTSTLEQAIDYIVETAQGVFIWVQLVGRELQRQVFASEEQIFGFLQKLPTGLESFYELMLERAREQSLPHLIKLFRFVLFAARPLLVGEIRHFLAVPDQPGDDCAISYRTLTKATPGKSYVTQCGGDFLEIKNVDGDEYVQFIHQTAREFLLQFPGHTAPPAPWTDSKLAHNHISIICLRYLMLCAKEDLPEHFDLWRDADFHRYAEYIDQLLFAQYAIEYLGRHLTVCLVESEVKVAISALAETICSSITCAFMDDWATCLGDDRLRANRDKTQYAKPFQMRVLEASVCGRFPVAVRIILCTGADVNHRDRAGACLLANAAVRGYPDMASVLLSHPEILPDVKDSAGRTPLSVAAEHGNADVVRVLLGHQDVDINSLDATHRTPLSYAAEYGREAAVKVLANNPKTDLFIADDRSRRPLSWAAIGGNECAMESLLRAVLSGISLGPDELTTGEWRAGINSKDDSGKAALSWAAYHGHYSVVKMMLDMPIPQGALVLDPNTSDDHEMTPLMLSASGGHLAVVDLLLHRDKVDVEVRNEDGMGVLSVAAASGHADIVALLLGDPRIYPNSKDFRGWTATCHAAFHGHKEVLRTLVADERTDVDLPDNDGLTPLWRASIFGRTNAVRVLISTKAVDLNIKDVDGWSPLAWAAQENHWDVVRELLQATGVEVDSADSRGLTPLWWAADRGNDLAVKLLLEIGHASLHTVDAVGQTPLIRAAWRGYERVVKAILRVDTSTCDLPERWGRTPLSWAVETGDIRIIRALLNTGLVDLDRKDVWGQTPRTRAADCGDDEIIRLFDAL
ncbi:uncharacterized protein DSM5745_03916 [Aspergillus mulundensis]|uniref:NACHT domain-containing protein n=1 Tax=Aspergillus mulundensis TaxID=1810919 RepID=A0A3D8SBA5_9EURO|nr:hypothetical protein DSM5745_03916 [Aspergillus mulundensis]RDW83590.1 hypothetical protein DSM5745_03916 [Aspergillus mulundensis]